MKTNSDAQYLIMCKEDGSEVTSWAASGNSTVSGNIRTWTVKYSFGGSGSRKMTFKAGVTKSTPGARTKTVMKTEMICRRQ